MSDESELKDKKEYELAAMLSEEVVAAEVEAVIRKYGGEMASPARVTSLRLAYPLKKHDSAFFAVFIFTALPGAVKFVKEDLALNPKVLRSLILTPPVKVVPREPRAPRVEKKEGALEVAAKPAEVAVSNEALEKKLEEILK